MKKSTWISALVLTGAVTLPFGLGYAWLNSYAITSLDRAVTEYRTLGLPFQAKELLPKAIRPEDNAAVAIRKIVVPRSFEDKSSLVLNLIEATDVAGADHAIGEIRSLIIQARQAARFPSVDFKRNWDMGPAVPLPEYNLLKQGVRALVLEARLESVRGNVTGAVQDLESAWHLGEFAGQDPTVFGVLIRIICNDFVLRGYEACFGQHAHNAVALEAFSVSIGRLKNACPDLGPAVRGQIYSDIATFRNRWLVNAKEIAPGKLRKSGLPEGYIARGELARYLNGCVKIHRLSHGYRDGWAVRQDRIHSRAGRFLSGSSRQYSWDVWWQSFSSLELASDRTLAQYRVTYGLAQALEARVKCGRYPTYTSLIDPFSASPIRFKPTAEGIRVYSIGPDRKDDHGLVICETHTFSANIGDIVASYPRVQSKARTISSGLGFKTRSLSSD